MYNKKSKDNLNSVHSFTSNTIPFLNSVHTNRYNKNTKKERYWSVHDAGRLVPFVLHGKTVISEEYTVKILSVRR